jgi:hypothetical protein
MLAVFLLFVINDIEWKNEKWRFFKNSIRCLLDRSTRNWIELSLCITKLRDTPKVDKLNSCSSSILVWLVRLQVDRLFFSMRELELHGSWISHSLRMQASRLQLLIMHTVSVWLANTDTWNGWTHYLILPRSSVGGLTSEIHSNFLFVG